MKKQVMILLAFLFLGFSQAIAQHTQVTGIVTAAEDGLPIVGASILVKGTTLGTITDIDGKFTLTKIPESAQTITISFIGMQSQTRQIQPQMKIQLKADTKMLDEVMVVAYGTVKKSAFTGSATIIEQDELRTPAASFDRGMAGKVSGVQVLSNSGQPGASTSFRIRGSGSLKASNEPLYVIDGVATTSASYSEVAKQNHTTSNILASINPNDIESITVLKDAAAAALYGSRAANGVVLITTKSGKEGKAKVNFNAQFSWASLGNSYDMMESDQLYKHIYTGHRNKGASMEEANKSAQGALTHNPFNVEYPLDAEGNLVAGAKRVVNTDWQKEVFNTAPSQDYNININGKAGKTSYFFSMGYTQQEGMIPASSYKRYSGKINVLTEANNWLNAGMNITFSHSVQNTTQEEDGGGSALQNALTFPNAVPVYVVDNEGVPVLDALGKKQYNFVNPIARDFNPLAIPHMDTSRSKQYRMLASAFAEIKFIEGLKFKTVFSPDFVYTNDHIYWNKEHGNGPAYNGRVYKYNNVDLMFTSTNTLGYSHIFNEDHSVNVMAGMEYWQSQYETQEASIGNLLGNMQELSVGSNVFAPKSETTKETLISYFGRAEYAFQDKYNLSASLRSDGSSIFGTDTKWGTFWSVGASWRINKEKFLQDKAWIDNLKLRVSYGTSGNKSGLDRYASLGLWKVINAYDEYHYGNNAGVGMVQLANNLLSWEKQSMFNIGLDFSFLNRFYGSIDYFNKTSDGLLYDIPLAYQNGIQSYTVNAAKVANNGVELTLGANILRGEVNWNVDLNVSFIKDEIKDLHGEDNVKMSDIQKIWCVGGSQYEFYMPTWAGVNAENGNPQWVKVNKDGSRELTSNYAEATFEKQGRSTPTAFGGLSTSVSYKGFDLSMQLNYTLGGKFYDSTYSKMMHDGSQVATNMHQDALNAWTTPGQVTDVPRYIIDNPSQSSSTSTRFMYNATNIRLKNITLSYTLPKNLGVFSKLISNAKVWVSADNLYTWFADSDYKGYDDIDIYGVQGYKRFSYVFPTPKTFSIGTNLTF